MQFGVKDHFFFHKDFDSERRNRKQFVTDLEPFVPEDIPLVFGYNENHKRRLKKKKEVGEKCGIRS